MKKIIFLILLFFVSFISFGQVYQAMPQYGYGPVKRMDFDSSLTIPTTCGVPTLKTILTKKAAIAFDSCNNRFYKYNPKTSTWSTIGGGNDTFNLQQVLNKGNTATQSGGTNSISLSDNSGYVSSLSSTGLQPTNNNDGSYGSYAAGNFFLHDGTSQNMTGGVADNGSFLDVANVYGNKINLTSEQTTNVPYLSWFNNQDGITQKLLPQYSLANSDIYMPYKNPIDTIATLADLRDINVQNGRFGNDTATIMMAKVHNDAGVTLTNGKVVAFSTSGTSSDAPSVKLANNKADSTSATTFGFVSGTIAVNDTGYVILLGKIEKLNTSSFANGDIIYLDSISGQYTKSKPQAPYHLVYLGTVVKANAGNGSIYVKVQNGYEISELHDVKITSPINNQVIAYSDTQQLWKNRNIYSIVDTTTTVATKSNVALKLNISDSASMLNPYLRKIDTTNKFVNTIIRTEGKDSIIFYIGGARYAIKDSTGGGGGSAAGSTGYVQFNTSGAFNADANLFWDNTNKRLGIGTVSPSAPLSVNGDITATNSRVGNNAIAHAAQIIGGNNSSTAQSFRLTNAGVNVEPNGMFGSISGTAGLITCYADKTYGFALGAGNGTRQIARAGINIASLTNTAGAESGDLTFLTQSGGTAMSEKMRIFGNGNTNIASAVDQGYKFYVNGTVGFSSTLSVGTSAAVGSQLQLGGTSAVNNVFSRLVNGGASTTPYLAAGNLGATAGNTAITVDPTNQLSFMSTNSGGQRTLRGSIQVTNLGNTAGSESGDMIFLTQSGGTAMSEKMRITSDGKIGIGTTAPTYSLEVKGSSAGVFLGQRSADNTGSANAYFYKTRGTVASPTAVINGDGIGVFNFGGHDGTNIVETSFFGGIVDNTVSASTVPIALRFVTGTTSANKTERMRISSSGGLSYEATNTASGTTGNQTINKISGTVNIAAAGTSITVTNSLVTTSSIVFATIRTNDATAVIKNVVPASGSFTINLTAAATAETSIGFFVIN